MPTIVELPDKTELEFPDGMDEPSMQQAISKFFPQFVKTEPAPTLPPPTPSISPTAQLAKSRLAFAPLAGQALANLPDKPLITLPEWPKGEGSLEEQITGQVYGKLKDFLGFMTSPKGAAVTGAAIAAPEVAGPIISAAMLPAAVEEGIGTVKSIGKGDIPGAAGHATGLALTGAGVLGGVAQFLPRTVAEARVPMEVPRAPEQITIPEPAYTGPTPPKIAAVEQAARRAAIKAARPVVPETLPEPERGMTILDEIRSAGADTKAKIQKLFPQLSRETAAKLRDQAFPREKQPDNLSRSEVDRLFLDKLNEESNREIEAATAPKPAPASEAPKDRGPLYDEEVKLEQQIKPGEQFRGAEQTEATREQGRVWGESLSEGTIIEEADGTGWRVVHTKRHGIQLERVAEDNSRLGDMVGGESAHAILARSRIRPQKPAPEIPEVRKIALEQQKAAGWNPDWPFVPADLMNKSFRDAIRSDPTIAAEEKAKILSFGPKDEPATAAIIPTIEAEAMPGVMVDKSIASHIRDINRSGFVTINSDSGLKSDHPSGQVERGYLQFETADPAKETFLAELGNRLGFKVERYEHFGAGEDLLGTPRSVVLRIPRSDLTDAAKLQMWDQLSSELQSHPFKPAPLTPAEQAEARADLSAEMGEEPQAPIAPEPAPKESAVRFFGPQTAPWPVALVSKSPTGQGWRYSWFAENMKGVRTPMGHDEFPTREQAVKAALDDNFVIEEPKPPEPTAPAPETPTAISAPEAKAPELTPPAKIETATDVYNEASALNNLPFSSKPGIKRLEFIKRTSAPEKQFQPPANSDTYWVESVRFDPDKTGGAGAWVVTVRTPKGVDEFHLTFAEAFNNPDFAAAKGLMLSAGQKMKGDFWGLVEGLAQMKDKDVVAFRLPGETLSASPSKVTHARFTPAQEKARQAGKPLKGGLDYGLAMQEAAGDLTNVPRQRLSEIREALEWRMGTRWEYPPNPQSDMTAGRLGTAALLDRVKRELGRHIDVSAEVTPQQKMLTAPSKVEAPAAKEPYVSGVSAQDKGISQAEKEFRSTAEGQKAMANRASRIAVLNQLNESIRKVDPKEAYDRALIEQTPDSQIDSMLESLRQDYNRLVAKPAAKPAAETGKEVGEPLQMSFEQFLNAPREGRLLEELRKLPRSPKTEAQLAAQAKYDAATESLEKAGLSWVLDRADPKQKAMVEAAMRKLPKTKQKLVAAYESALNEQVKASSSGTEGQRKLYDKAVEAGIIEPPEMPPTKPGVPTQPGTPEARLSQSLQSVPKQKPPPQGPAAQPMGITPFPGLVTGLQKVAQSAQRVWHEIADAPKFAPFKRVINKFNGDTQRTSLKIRQMQADIESRVPDPKRLEAITNWLQADGDVAKLRAWEAASRNATRRQGYRDAQRLTPYEVQVAKAIRQYYDDLLARGQAYGILDQAKDDYVTQIWKRPLLGGAQFAQFTSKLSRTFKFGMKSVFENFFEGEQAGFKPVTKNISKLLGVYVSELEKTIATRDMIRDLTHETASDGNPLAKVEGTAHIAQDQAGDPTGPMFVRPGVVKGDVRYAELNHPALKNWKWISKDPESGRDVFILGELRVHPEIRRHLANVLSQSQIRKWMREPSESELANIVKLAARFGDTTSKVVKQTMLGTLSTFHHVQEGTHGIGHRANAFLPPKLPVGTPELNYALDHGLQLAGEGAALENFREGLGSHGVFDKVPVLGKWIEKHNDLLFNEYIPRLKWDTWQRINRRNMARYQKEIASGEVTADDVAYLSSKQTNAAFGHQNYADLGRNATAQHVLRLFALAPDFLEARTRFAGQAAQGVLSKVGREQLEALSLLGGLFYIGARIGNKLSDNDWHWEEPFRVKYGNRWYGMRSVPEDLWRAFNDTRVFAYNRLNPVFGRPTMELLSGVNYRGEKIPASEVFKNILVSGIPIQMREFPAFRSLTETQRNTTIGAWEQFLSSVGVQVSRYSPLNQTYKLATKWRKAQGEKEAPTTYPVSKYQPLRYALEDHDLTRAADELAKLTEGGKVPLTKIAQGFRVSLHRPFSGSLANEGKFVASLTPDQKALYKEAIAQRSRVWREFTNAEQEYHNRLKEGR